MNNLSLVRSANKKEERWFLLFLLRKWMRKGGNVRKLSDDASIVEKTHNPEIIIKQ